MYTIGENLSREDNEHAVRIFALETGEETAVLHGHTKGVISLLFSSDGKRLYSGGYDHTVRVWDVSQ